MPRKSKEHKQKRQKFFSLDKDESAPNAFKKLKDAHMPDGGDEGSDSSEEQQPVRKWTSVKEELEEAGHTTLPIRTTLGKWLQKPKKESPPLAEEHSDTESDTNTQGEKDMTPVLSVAEAKEDLAQLAISITEDSEGNVSRLREMLSYADYNKHSPEVIRLAMISILAVFKNILPGYYIRPSNSAEKSQTVSKDIKQIRVFEESILANYKKYFELLKETIRPKKGTNLVRKKAKMNLPTAIACVTELAQFTTHFNYYEDLLFLLGQCLALDEEELVDRVVTAFTRLFEGDEQGKVTMQCIRLISNMTKDRNYDCPPQWLVAVERIRLRGDIAERKVGKINQIANRKQQHLSRQQKKDIKARREELQKLAEAESIVTREEMSKWNSESIKYLFRIYFGILKNCPRSELLPLVLAGLAKHSHRIGVEYFVDLLVSLRKLMERRGSDELDLTSALHCITTIDKIYSINENLSEMDFKFFYNSLFRQLYRLCEEVGEESSRWDIIQKPLQTCLSNLFHAKRHLPAVRVAAFLQRLADMAIALLQKHIIGPAVFMLDNMHSILVNHSKAASVLDAEPFGQGSYLIAGDDPDFCNPFARSLFVVLQDVRRLAGDNGKVKSLLEQILKLA